jgi:hypothetical protein
MANHKLTQSAMFFKDKDERILLGDVLFRAALRLATVILNQNPSQNEVNNIMVEGARARFLAEEQLRQNNSTPYRLGS